MILPMYCTGQSVEKWLSLLIKVLQSYKRSSTICLKPCTKSEGVGLAAPQIGLGIVVVVIDASPMAEEPSLANSKMALINPHIELSRGQCRYRRVVLSLPGIHESVTR